MDYYEKTKNNQHIFVYSVWGRTGSTALQRILNSSREVVIYGEPHYVIDDILGAISVLESKRELFEKSYQALLEKSLLNNNHRNFYPNALTNTDSTRKILANALSNLLMPKTDVDRFGFKEIRIRSIVTLNYLNKLFPNAKIIFLFRNPLAQWNSIEKRRWWHEEIPQTMDAFLRECKRISDIYIKFAKEQNKLYFLDHQDIKDRNQVIKLFKFCNLKSFDGSLINSYIDLPVKKTEGFTLSDSEQTKIMNSEAYKNYLEMKRLSESFLTSL